jgi:hypothetical protein
MANAFTIALAFNHICDLHCDGMRIKDSRNWLNLATSLVSGIGVKGCVYLQMKGDRTHANPGTSKSWRRASENPTGIGSLVETSLCPSKVIGAGAVFAE